MQERQRGLADVISTKKSNGHVTGSEERHMAVLKFRLLSLKPASQQLTELTSKLSNEHQVLRNLKRKLKQTNDAISEKDAHMEELGTIGWPLFAAPKKQNH